MLKKIENNCSDKKNFVFKILFIVITIIFTLYVIFDLVYFEHAHKNYINNIYDISVKEDDNFIFLGDSITESYNLNEFYEGLPVVNSGIGGNTTEDILSSMDERVYRYNPTKVFLLIGVNDLGSGKSVDYIYNNILKIVSEIKKNRSLAKIYVESVFPINDSDDEKIVEINVKNSDIDKLNKKLKNHFKDSDVVYIDVNSKLRDDENRLKLEYTKEGLHISSLGYLKITKILLPYLND